MKSTITRRHSLPYQLCLLIIMLLGGGAFSAHADVVKPALLEMSLYPDGHFELEARASIEGLLTGIINTKYRNTREAPNAAEYNRLRAMSPDALAKEFAGFQAEYLKNISLKFDDVKVAMTVGRVEIPEPGYKKVPRISLIVLKGRTPEGSRQFSWRYPKKYGDDAFRYRHYKKGDYTWSEWLWLRNGESYGPVSIQAAYTHRPVWKVALSYIQIGFLHILPGGWDHILFILGIFLLSQRLSTLLWQVTAFTIAHTITLGLSMYGLIHAPEQVIQPLIALSIAYVGIENVFVSKLHAWRVVVVFLFGLLHGMSFAKSLADFGMPKEDFALALVTFNVGVELGQLTLLLLAFMLIGLPFSHLPNYRRWVVVPASLAIGLIGLVWMIDRL